MDGTRKGAYGYDEIDHAADWALRVWAPDLVNLFITAARGMYSLLGVTLRPGTLVHQDITIDAADHEGMLVGFLSELLFLCEQGKAFERFALTLDDYHVWGSLEGGFVSSMQKEIKAVTYHNLAIQHEKDHFEVTIVFDV